MGTSAAPAQSLFAKPIAASLRAENKKSLNSVKTFAIPSEVNAPVKLKKISTLEKTKPLHRVMNLSKSELLTEDSATQRDNKRKDLTRPVYIPGQTYHPDELQKITFNNPKTKQQYYFCKNHGSKLWRIPKRGTTVS